MEKSLIIKIVVLALVLIAGVAFINEQKSKVKYLDYPCPNCGSDEVGDFGEDIHNNFGTKGHCFDCGMEFYVED